MIDHGETPLPPNRASYYAEDQPSLRTGSQADLDHATRRSELHGRRQPGAVGRSGSSASASTRTKGWCSTRSRYDDDGRSRSVLHRASISEMVVPYGRPGRAAGVEERVRRRRVGTRPHDAAAHARLRLRRRDPLLRRHARERAGRAVDDRERDLHARRGLRDPLEARRPATVAAARCAAVADWSSAPSRPSATTSTASSGTSTSTATSSSR